MTSQPDFWGSPYMYQTQPTNHKAHCVSMTPILPWIPFRLFLTQHVLCWDNTSSTTMRDCQTKRTQMNILRTPIMSFVKWKSLVSE